MTASDAESNLSNLEFFLKTFDAFRVFGRGCKQCCILVTPGTAGSGIIH